MQYTTHSNSQAVYGKLIGPLAAAFGPSRSEFNRELVGRLENYSATTLEKATNHLIETCKRRPLIAEIIEACKGAKSYNHYAPAIPEFESIAYLDKANAAMKTTHGKQSIYEGWGLDYWAHVRDTGNEEITSQQVSKFRDGLINARMAATKLDAPEMENNIALPILKSLWRSMQQREQELGRMAA